MSKTFFVTTPIYYVNGAPHIGAATTTVMADAIYRFQKLRGREAFLLTGIDEHAKKVADAAAKAGKPTQQFVDELAVRFTEAWEFLGIEPDRFIRTSDPDHKHAVAEAFRRLQGSDDIYKGSYSGWFSVTDETYYSDSEVEDGRAKHSGSGVERVTEENYYFRLSSYGERLLETIEANPEFLLPDTRRNEVVAFIQEGLRDVPVSRRNTGWGIPVPSDPEQVVYVWFDALINYLTATGWPDAPDWRRMWPAEAHIMGKEIYTRFHATLWPAMLMGLQIPLPQHVIGHGWWLIAGKKGSKSEGNIPTPEQAVAMIEQISHARHEQAVDALRYYLLRDISFTSDAEFDYANLASRYNGELCNDFGNLLNRSLNMLWQYEAGVVPEAKSREGWSEMAALAKTTSEEVAAAMEAFDPPLALAAIAKFVSANNKAIDTAAPWKRAKEGNTAAVREALYDALESTRLLSVLLEPFMPATTRRVRVQLGLGESIESQWDVSAAWGGLAPGTQTQQGEPLFPRIEKAEIALLTANYQEAKQTRGKMTTTESNQQNGTAAPIAASQASAGSTPAPIEEKITIQDFARIQLRVAEIKSADRIEGATKLLRLMIDVGEPEPRQLVAGIAESYAPEDLPGRKIVVVANLQPAKIRGVESNGMLLAATDPEGRAILLRPDKEIAAGAKVK